MDLCEYKATLGYTGSIQTQILMVVTHTFNPSVWESHIFHRSTREVETGDMAGQREEYKGEETGTHWSVKSEDLWRQDLALLVEALVEVKGLSSGWLLFFSDLHVEPQYLSLGFIIPATEPRILCMLNNLSTT